MGLRDFGIRLNTAILSLVNDLFLRGLPYAEPDRVVPVYSNAKDRDRHEIPLSAPQDAPAKHRAARLVGRRYLVDVLLNKE